MEIDKLIDKTKQTTGLREWNFNRPTYDKHIAASSKLKHNIKSRYSKIFELRMNY